MKDDCLLGVQKVSERLGIKVRTVWRYSAAGLIPAPIKFGGNTRWRASDVDRFIALGGDMAAFNAERRGVAA